MPKELKEEILEAKLITAPKQIEAKSEVELTDEQIATKEAKELVKRKARRLNIYTSEHYITKLLNKPPEEIMDKLIKMDDALMLLVKEMSMRYLEDAAAGELYAMQNFAVLMECMAKISDDRIKLTKTFMGTEDNPSKNAPYKTKELSAEEWEEQFKPGLPAPKQEPPEIYTGPKSGSVN